MFCKKGEWNEDYLSLRQVKIVQALCAIGIVFHHMSQRTCAPWLNPMYIRHGLDAFVNLGFLFVAFFLFSSGYGLFKSVKAKENYLKGFLGKRIGPIVFVYIVSAILFFTLGAVANPYAWYVAAIIYLYFIFFLAFRFIKNDYVALSAVTVFTILYIVVCHWMMFGEWWYNTVGLFIVGLWFAKLEDKLFAFMKKGYVIHIIISVVVFAVSFYYAEIVGTKLFWLELLAAISFTFFIILIGMKVRLKSKVLEFFGAFTLEIYLLHGVFVQLFSFSFVNDDNQATYYIEKVWLYVIVVLLTGLTVSYLVYLLRRVMGFVAKKYELLVKSIIRDIQMIGVGILVVFAILTAVSMYNDSKKKDEKAKAIAEYESKYITYEKINGKQMATYDIGEGDETIILLRGLNDPCPTITMRGLAEGLAKDYRVIVVDSFGTGFSDDATSERSVKFFTTELHSLIQAKGVTEPYILLPQGISGVYAQYYVSKFPSEVKAVFAIESETAGSVDAIMQKKHMSAGDYERMQRRNGSLYHGVWSFIDKCGYGVYFWHMYEKMYQKTIPLDEMTAASAMVIGNLYSSNSVDEMINEFDAYTLTKDMKYPEGMKYVIAYSEGLNKTYDKQGLKLSDYHKVIVSNPDDYSEIKIVDAMYTMCYTPDYMAKLVHQYLSGDAE